MPLNLSDIAELSTIRDWVRWGASRFSEAGLFFGHGTDNAFDESLALVLHALHLDHNLPADFLDTRITAGEREQVLAYLRQRIEAHVPAAYITHEAHFAGLSFYVNENVLVPRSPIAELIENGFNPWLPDTDAPDILDLCTGSGCIAIACAHYLPHARVDASDISPLALDVARVNVERHGMEDQVSLYRSDVFDELPASQYDLIVSNPPYVSLEEMQGLPEEFRHEPALGLEAGIDGMDIVARILCQGSAFLKPGGIMIVEVGDSMGHLMERYPEVPFLWLEFERGGHGVFLLTTEQLND
ncbi:50S ribosomal protein L3 N(5)-glutamine methyltransferase, partial [Thiolapillus sp.]